MLWYHLYMAAAFLKHSRRWDGSHYVYEPMITSPSADDTTIWKKRTVLPGDVVVPSDYRWWQNNLERYTPVGLVVYVPPESQPHMRGTDEIIVFWTHGLPDGESVVRAIQRKLREELEEANDELDQFNAQFEAMC